MANRDADDTSLDFNIEPEPKPDFQGNLKWKVLKGLPEGMFLESNTTDDDPLTPIFAGTVGAKETRKSLWSKLKELQVDGRMFRGFMTEKSYDEWFMEKVRALMLSDVIR